MSYAVVMLPLILLFSCLATTCNASAKQTEPTPNHVSRRYRGILSARKKCLSRPHFTCQFSPTQNNAVTGRVHFQPIFRKYRTSSRVRCLVKISALVRNLTPGLHGFHIHQFGDIRANDGTSTGGHFKNPADRDVAHGYPDDPSRHWGDFGNLTARPDGIAVYRRVDSVVRLGGIVGRGMIIHALDDKGRGFQPSGAAGSRQAHCVIGYANPTLPTRPM